jgi:uncharacterized protein
VATLGPSIWASALAEGQIERLTKRPIFGRLGPPDALGVRLPPEFSARLIARSGDFVAGTDHVWHRNPDGGGVVSKADGGWIYTSNSEVLDGLGGVSAISFGPSGEIDNAYSILSGTTGNCAGGMTPWGTWLSCEEFSGGRVFECDPFKVGIGVVRPLLGTFAHEAAAVDPVRGPVYLTEDQPNGRLYRFTPDVKGRLDSGQLHAAYASIPPSTMQPGDVATVTWVPTSTTTPERSARTSEFRGGEGAWVDGDRLIFTTKRDARVWTLDLIESTLELLHDAVASPSTPLNKVDNVVVHPITGDIFVAEDGDNMELCVLREDADGSLAIEACLQIVGQDASEITGPAFSPDGRRLYVSSQRGFDLLGLTYEITGPFVAETIPISPLRKARRMSATFGG